MWWNSIYFLEQGSKAMNWEEWLSLLLHAVSSGHWPIYATHAWWHREMVIFLWQTYTHILTKVDRKGNLIIKETAHKYLREEQRIYDQKRHLPGSGLSMCLSLSGIPGLALSYRLGRSVRSVSVLIPDIRQCHHVSPPSGSISTRHQPPRLVSWGFLTTFWDTKSHRQL